MPAVGARLRAISFIKRSGKFASKLAYIVNWRARFWTWCPTYDM
jgi:hypothetical protein